MKLDVNTGYPLSLRPDEMWGNIKREPWDMSQRRRKIARAAKGRQNHLASRDFCRPFGAKIIEFHLLVDPRADALGYGLTPPLGLNDSSRIACQRSVALLLDIRRAMDYDPVR